MADKLVWGMICLNAGAALAYGFERDWPRVGYFVGGFILLTSTLFMGRP